MSALPIGTDCQFFEINTLVPEFVFDESQAVIENTTEIRYGEEGSNIEGNGVKKIGPLKGCGGFWKKINRLNHPEVFQINQQTVDDTSSGCGEITCRPGKHDAGAADNKQE